MAQLRLKLAKRGKVLRMFNEIVKPTLVLVIIAAIVSGLLATTYNVTGVGELGNGISQEKLDEIVKEVIPKATKLKDSGIKLDDQHFLGIYEDEGGAGIAIHVVTKGYGGKIKMLVGLDNDGNVVGSKIMETAETPNLGTKIGNPDFTTQFIGKNTSVAAKKKGGDIDTISGATISSKAFITGVNIAFEFYELTKEEVIA